MALLQASELTRRFGGVVAVDDVSFDVGENETVGLIGPNGAGKTTVFNLISRVYKPDRGSITFQGRNLLSVPAHKLARLGIGRTFQGCELFNHLSVLDNVLVGAHSQPGTGTGRKAREHALEILNGLGLGKLAAHPAAGLPFPTLKRIELAKTIAGKPKLLLLDEPAGGLNHEELDELAQVIVKLKAEFKLTILLVEHHMNFVMGIADRIHVLDFGRRIATGTPQEVSANPAVIAAYLGSAERGPNDGLA